MISHYVADDSEMTEQKKDEQIKTYDNFKKQWEMIAKPSSEGEQPFNLNKLLINRTAAACTTKLSTVVSEEIFNKTYKWFINEIFELENDRDLITKAKKLLKSSWYEKNTFLMDHLHEVFKDDLKNASEDLFYSNYDEYYLSIFVWCIYENSFSIHVEKKQIIKYGPPGTGKTFSAMDEANSLFSIWNKYYNRKENALFSKELHIEKVQFHPSFCYEDFIEGLRPTLSANNQVELKLVNGIFKDFCIKAAKWEIDYYVLIHASLSLNIVNQKDWEELTIDDLETLKTNLNDSSCSIPNEIKSILDRDYWSFIFEYANNSDVKSATLVHKIIPPYFFLIDEINRAELSRVLGELMFCLEYRGIAGSIKTPPMSHYLSIDNLIIIRTDK